MNPQERIAVWHKYQEHCAYCGREITYAEMQVDHKHPQHLAHWIRNDKMQSKFDLPDDVNAFENLMPSCRRCNNYKRGHRLEPFRYLMKTLYKRLQAIYINKVAADYGIVEYHVWNGVFYFEFYEEQ